MNLQRRATFQFQNVHVELQYLKPDAWLYFLQGLHMGLIGHSLVGQIERCSISVDQNTGGTMVGFRRLVHRE